MNEREPLTDTRFGAIAVWGGMLRPEDLEQALDEQASLRATKGGAPKIGEMLLDRGLIGEEQLRAVLKVQLQRLPAEGHLLFGQIALARRLLSREALQEALDAQAREMLSPGKVRRIGEILLEKDAMTREAVEAVLEYQGKLEASKLAEASKAARKREGAPEAAPSVRPPPDVGKARDRFSEWVVWIVLAVAAVLALLLIYFKEAIFGLRPPPG